MVATVLVGRARSGPGIVARVFNLPREDARSESELRNLIINQWALLDQWAAPRDEAETVLKLSRHLDAENAIWTWLGWYRAARFPDNARGGAYIGCGIIWRNAVLEPRPALAYVTKLLSEVDGLKDTNGVLSYSVYEIDEESIGVSSSELPTLPLRSALGLQPGVRRAYIDLQKFDAQGDTETQLLDFIDKAQRSESFGNYAELVVGSTAALAERVNRSGGYDVFTPAQWQAETHHAVAQASTAVRQLSTAGKPYKGTVISLASQLAQKEEARRESAVAASSALDPQTLRAELTALEARIVRRLTPLLSEHAGTPSPTRQPAFRLRLPSQVWPLLAIATGTALAVWLASRPTAEQPSLAPAKPALCEMAPLPPGPPTREEEQLVQEELNCLKQLSATTNGRMQTLEETLRREHPDVPLGTVGNDPRQGMGQARTVTPGDKPLPDKKKAVPRTRGGDSPASPNDH